MVGAVQFKSKGDIPVSSSDVIFEGFYDVEIVEQIGGGTFSQLKI